VDRAALRAAWAGLVAHHDGLRSRFVCEDGAWRQWVAEAEPADLLTGSAAGPFDLVYDSGCFHHIAPHRRITYLDRILPLVRGRFAVVTFAAERMETPSDLDIVTTGDTYGGMTFSLDDLRTIFAALTPVELRPVNPARPNTFAPDFLNTALFTNL